MPDQVETETQPGLTNLVSGIIHDAGDLARQQLTLFQVEFRNDMHRTAAAVIPLIAGIVVCLLAGIILAMAGAYLLPWLWPILPLWAGFAIVGSILGVAGAALVLRGKAKFDTFNPLPDKAVQGLKENIQWKTKT